MGSKERFRIAEPAKCTRMSEEETEYDGGFLNFFVAAVTTVAGVGCSYMARKTGNRKWTYASYACTAASAFCSFGVSAMVGSVAKVGVQNASKLAVKITSSRIAGSSGRAVMAGRMTKGEYDGYSLAYSAVSDPSSGLATAIISLYRGNRWICLQETMPWA